MCHSVYAAAVGRSGVFAEWQQGGGGIAQTNAVIDTQPTTVSRWMRISNNSRHLVACCFVVELSKVVNMTKNKSGSSVRATMTTNHIKYKYAVSECVNC